MTLPCLSRCLRLCCLFRGFRRRPHPSGGTVPTATNCQTRYCVHSILSNQVLCSLGIVKPGTVFTLFFQTRFTRYCQTGFVFTSCYQTRYGVHSVLVKPDIFFTRYCQTRYCVHSGVVKSDIVFTRYLSLIHISEPTRPTCI